MSKAPSRWSSTKLRREMSKAMRIVAEGGRVEVWSGGPEGGFPAAVLINYADYRAMTTPAGVAQAPDQSPLDPP
jgi:prevent-host-death family protein